MQIKMELFRVPRCRCGATKTWKTLIHAVVFLVCIQRTWSQGSSPEVTARVGETVTLPAPVTTNINSFSWYRGTAGIEAQRIFTYFMSSPQANGPRYTGREMGLADGSLQIIGVLMSNTGNYTVTMTITNGATPQGTIQLRVYENVSVPFIHAVPQNPVENGSLVLCCNASGTEISYQWYREDKVVTTGDRISLTNTSQNLTLSHCTRTDTGTNFTCRASNAVSSSTSRPYTVTISYGPDPPVILVSPEKPFYTTGSALTFTCTAASYPPAQYTWLLNEQPLLTPGQELKLTPLTLYDSGNYTCNSSNSVTQLSTRAARGIRVLENVSLPIIRAEPRNPVENGSLALLCNASGTDVSYQWYQADAVLTSGGRISLSNSRQTLTLSPCNRSDTGTNFTCRASNAVSSSTSSPYTATISYGPDTPVISVSTDQPFHAVGSALTFSCTAASYPPALYTWLLNGQSLQKTEHKLLINSLTLRDSGNYTCNTSNNITHLSNHATRGIHVLENVTKPIVNYVSAQLVENRGPANITCDTSNAETILWFFNNSPVLPSNIMLSADNRTLIIKNVTRGDTGTYQCEGINPVSRSKSDPKMLTVAYGPENITINPAGSQQLPVGAKLSLTCTALSVPGAAYQWLLNDNDLKQYGSTFTIAKVSPKDNGSYTCEAQNPVSQLSVKATVSIYVNGTDDGFGSNTDGPPVGVIVGAVIGALALVAIVGALVYFFVIKKPVSGAPTSNNSMDAANSTKPASTNAKAAGNGEELQYSSVNFVPKPGIPMKPITTDTTVYSEVRRQ
ncbi:carcinoembryonic antigen-related cell adhesion molecule 5-like isoform X1 [Ambystoma mexicanum]|uniref:carcinoembryonic antigen-related cell adhesion molecule 5-like isoform X1 n=1 Tax=Ambystoma mexicanum TaxID=8296 RepID=UPI0037E83AD2